jgi:hypothetical protein
LSYKKGIANESSFDWMKASIALTDYRTPVTEFSKRHIFTAYLKKLEPKSVYTFKITEPSWDSNMVQLYTYKTFDPERVKIINGGDIGNNDLATEMYKKVVAPANGDVIMVGGDTAYDQNAPSAFRAWDYLLKRIPISIMDSEAMKSNNGSYIRIVPIIFGVGNHDIGANTNQNVVLRRTIHEPTFLHYFPQHTHNGMVPSIYNRRTYFGTTIGDNIQILSPDIGQGVGIDGDQLVWLEQQLSESKAKVKFIQYHGPIYSACSHSDPYTKAGMEYGKKYWTPLFDKYNVTIAFENHTHAFKRSKLIKNGKPDSAGTLYLGEGSWGILGTYCEKINIDLHEIIQEITNAWIIDVDVKSKITAEAYSHTGALLDITTLFL